MNVIFLFPSWISHLSGRKLLAIAYSSTEEFFIVSKDKSVLLQDKKSSKLPHTVLWKYRQYGGLGIIFVIFVASKFTRGNMWLLLTLRHNCSFWGTIPMDDSFCFRQRAWETVREKKSLRKWWDGFHGFSLAFRVVMEANIIHSKDNLIVKWLYTLQIIWWFSTVDWFVKNESVKN